MEKDVFDIIASKEHSQLTKEELELVNEVCVGEDEFLQMKKVLSDVSRMAKNKLVEPSPNVKSKLDDLFLAQSFPKSTPVWYNKVALILYPTDKKFFQRPLVRIAAIVILIIGILPFLLKNELSPSTPQMAENLAPKKEQEKTTITEVKQETNSLNTSHPTTDEASESDRSNPIELVSSAPIAFSDALEELSSDAMLTRTLTSTHPDGIFAGAVSSQIESHSIPVSEQPDVLDLLTATF